MHSTSVRYYHEIRKMCTDHKLGVFSEMARIWPNDKISPFLKNVKSYLHPKSKKIHTKTRKSHHKTYFFYLKIKIIYYDFWLKIYFSMHTRNIQSVKWIREMFYLPYKLLFDRPGSKSVPLWSWFLSRTTWNDWNSMQRWVFCPKIRTFLSERMIKNDFRCSRTAQQSGGDTIWIPCWADLAETFCLSR